jgi:hypothetical protein
MRPYDTRTSDLIRSPGLYDVQPRPQVLHDFLEVEVHLNADDEGDGRASNVIVFK